MYMYTVAIIINLSLHIRLLLPSPFFTYPFNVVLIPTEIARRVIACLDVRSNDSGDLVVTKGD